MGEPMVQADTRCLEAASAALQAFAEEFERRHRLLEASIEDLVQQFFDGSVQRMIADFGRDLSPRIAAAKAETISLSGRMRALARRLAEIGYVQLICGQVPPRVYIINGIGSMAPIGDPDATALLLAEHLAAYGFAPDEVVPLPAIYNQRSFATEMAIAGIKFDPRLPASVKEFMIDGLIRADGAKDVWEEFSFTGDMRWTWQVGLDIMQHIQGDPLLETQGVVVIGYSGGGAVAVNMVPYLEARGIDVETVVLAGSPLANVPMVNGKANVIDIMHADDSAVRAYLRQVPGPLKIAPFLDPTPYEKVEFTTPSEYPHGWYMREEEMAAFLAEELLNKSLCEEEN